jgi:hypothetical protein
MTILPSSIPQAALNHSYLSLENMSSVGPVEKHVEETLDSDVQQGWTPSSRVPGQCFFGQLTDKVCIISFYLCLL